MARKPEVFVRLGGSADPSAAQANPGRRPAARPLLMALASGFGRRGAQAVDDPAEQEGYLAAATLGPVGQRVAAALTAAGHDALGTYALAG